MEDLPGYDNWKTSPPEPKVATTCDWCDEDICEGEEAYVTDDGDTVHTQCWDDYSKEELGATLQSVHKPGGPKHDG